ncbi:MAG: efflux RND transporter periplasmic adaptor subunit [Candidatus Binatus sp.]|nr:efflux RND transporter periplasmic adaptor subunit [Candidatus Binatus sp.]
MKGNSKLKEQRASRTNLRISTIARQARLRAPMRAIARAAMLTMIALAMLNSGCSRGAPDQGFGGGAEVVPVLAAKVVQKNVAESIRAIGRVEAFSTVDIKAQINGQVTQVHFHEGQDVKKGDLLFTIDPRPFEAALHQAEANLARDRAQFKQADANEKRYAYLVKQGVGSPQQYDQAQAAAASLAATLQADEATVQTAKLNLGYTAIRSPIDGRTGNLLVHAGNIVKPDADTPMVVINQVHPVYVTFSIPEQKLAQVREVMTTHKLPVEVSFPNVQQTETGEMSFVDNSVDAKTGTIALKGLFANTDGRLWPGEFVNATLIVAERANAILVPSQAVQTGQQGSYVFVVAPGMKVESRKIVIGASIDGQTVVTGGLKAGETVVTDGQLRLIPGSKVTIKSGLTDHEVAS